MKFPHTSSRLLRRIPLCLALSSLAAQADTLFSEGFDSDQAKVSLRQRSASGSAIQYVDYSDFERAAPTAAGTLRMHIPEAPGKIAGSAPTRGVVLSALYDSPDRSIMLLAADMAEGNPVTFSGNYRLTFDMWLSLDPTATGASAGTTEGGLWTVNSPGVNAPARYWRSSSTGNWGWLSTEGGLGAGTGAAAGVPSTAGNGDASFYNSGVQTQFRENVVQDGAMFAQTFPQGSPTSRTPNNQWTTVEVSVTANSPEIGGSHVRVKFNGVLFLEQDSPLADGFAGLGYDDLFTSTTVGGGASFSPNWQFGLFDNLVVESIPETLPSLAVEPQTAFTLAGDSSPVLGDFAATNSGTAELRILSATIDGPDAAQFSFPPEQTFPVVVPGQGDPVSISVNFSSTIPNGLKVARLVLTTNDPGAPTITVPLQGRRKVLTVEGPALTRVPSVTVENGTGTGQILITNSSESDVTLSAGTFSGANPADFAITTPFPIVLPAGGNKLVDVKFSPTGTIGLHSALAEFTTSDPNLPTLSLAVKGRYAYGPPLLAQYALDEADGTTFVDSAGVSPNLAVEIRTQPAGYSAPSLLPNGQGTAFHFAPAETNTTGNFAHGLVPHLPNVSYAVWIKPEAKEASTTNRTILHRSSLFSTLGTLYSLNLSPTGQLAFDINKLNAGTLPVVSTADKAIVDGQTYQIVVTHSDENGFSDGNTPVGTRTRLYVNGALVSQEVLEPEMSPAGYTDYTLTTTSEGLYVGSATSSGAGYQGDMDDLQIYSVELTPEQVAAMYQQPGKNAFNLDPVTVPVPFDITGSVYNPAAGTLTLTWTSQAGAVYNVQQSETLSGWTTVPTLGTVPSAGATTTAVISGVTPGGKNFYRIGRVSP